MSDFDCAWYEADADELAKEVVSLGERLWEQDTDRRREISKNLKRFNGRTLRGVSSWSDVGERDNARLNITKSATETLMSRIGSNRPRPRILTTNAQYGTRVRAKKLQQFIDGGYKQVQMYRNGKRAVRDAILTGTGVIGFYPDVARRQVAAERVFPAELLVDQDEAATGNPQNMARIKLFDRGLLGAKFPHISKEDIASIPSVDSSDLAEFGIKDPRSDMSRIVKVVEAWHLAVPLDLGAKTDSERYEAGRHVMAAGLVTLHDEPYWWDRFPFSFLPWCEAVVGFWGDSAVAEIRGLEKEANILLQRIQRAMKLAGQVTIIASDKAGVSRAKLTDEVMNVLEYKMSGGSPPTAVTMQPVHHQLIEQVWQLRRACFEQLGTNENQAAAVKPPGIESGKALAQLSEEHQVRFKDFSQNYEQFLAEDCAAQYVHAAKELDRLLKDRGVREGYVVKDATGKSRISLKWSECAVTPDDFFIECWPTSVLPVSPAGRTEVLKEWQDNGWVTPQRAMVLAELPDLESEQNLATADSELLEWQLASMIDDNEQVVPEDRQNLAYALQRGTYALCAGIKDGVPEQHLDKVRIFLDLVQSKLEPPPPPPMNPGMGGPLPMAGPSGPAPYPVPGASAAPGGPLSV